MALGGVNPDPGTEAPATSSLRSTLELRFRLPPFEQLVVLLLLLPLPLPLPPLLLLLIAVVAAAHALRFELTSLCGYNLQHMDIWFMNSCCRVLLQVRGGGP